MRFIVPVCLLLLSGCFGPSHSDVKPEPPSPSTAVAKVAEQSLRDYGTGIAKVARGLAADVEAGKIDDHTKLFEAYQDGTKQTREQAMRGYELAFEKAVDPTKPFDKTAAAKALREVADGFERGAK